MRPPVPYVVQADTWMGPANVQGSMFIRRGTLVSISPDNDAMAATYGGWGNLVPLAPTGDGSTADRASQGIEDVMALARFVVTSRVVITPDTIATVVAGEPQTGGAAGHGSTATIPPAAGSESKYGYLVGQVFVPGQVVYADSAAGFATGPQLLYQAIGASNLRPYVQGQDGAGHGGLAN